MSSRPRPDPSKRIEDLPDSVIIGERTFSDLRLLEPIEHQQRLAALYEVADGCGCVLGGVFGVLALAGYLAALYLVPSLLPASIGTRVWLGLGFLVVAAGIGKLIGQLHAKRRFDNAAYGLEQRILVLREARSAVRR